MSKRFFSLLLVVVMVLSFAAPALAANDGISTIARKDFNADAKDGPEGMKSLYTQLQAHTPSGKAYNIDAYGQTGKLNGDDTYTAESWTAFAAAMEAGLDLRDKYESTSWEIKDDEFSTAASNIKSAFALLSKDATDAEKQQLKDLIAEATELDKNQELLSTNRLGATPTLTTPPEGQRNGFIDWANNILTTNPVLHKSVAAPMTGAIDTLKDAIAKAKVEDKNLVTAKLKASYDIFGDNTTGTAKGAIKFSVDGFNKDKDEHYYALFVSFNGSAEVPVITGLISNGTSKVNWVQVPAIGNLGVGNDGIITYTELKALFPNAEFGSALKSTDTVTLTLKDLGKKDRENPEGVVEVASTVTVPCVHTDEVPASPANVLSSGFVGDKNAENTSHEKIDVNGNVIPAVIVSKSSYGDNVFYIVLDKTINDGIAGSVKDPKSDAIVSWRITSPSGSVVTAQVASGMRSATDFIIAMDGTGNISQKLKSADATVGTYKIEVVYNEKDSDTEAKPETVIFTTTVNIPKVDKSVLTTYMEKKGINDSTQIAANYGPYANTSALMVMAKLAKEYIAKDEVAIAANIRGTTNKTPSFTSGNVNTSTLNTGLGHEKQGPDPSTGWFKNIDDALKQVIDLRDLKAAIAEAKALNKNAYQNWDGLMKTALANAIAAYNALTTDLVYTDYKFDSTGDGKNDATTQGSKPFLFGIRGNKSDTTADGAENGTVVTVNFNGLSAANVDILTSELKTAIKWLNGTANPDEKDGLYVEGGKLYLYVGGEVQKTGRTEWPVGSGIYYYFSVKDGHAMKNGVVQAAGTTQYVANAEGVLQTGYVKVGSDAYYCSVKDHHIMKNGIVSAGGTRQYIAGKDGKLKTDKQTVGSNSYYCSIKDHHIWKAIKNTAWVTGTVAKYQINAKGVIIATKPLKG